MISELDQQVEVFQRHFRLATDEIGKRIVGYHDIVEGILVSLLANGHVLLEGIPGLGKTKLVHTLSDVLVTLSILVSFAFARWPAYPLIDAALSLAIAGLIAVTGFRIFARTLPVLTDKLAVDPEVVADIALDVPGALGCHDVRSRQVGEAIFIEMHIEVRETDNLRAHAITEEIEARLRSQLGPLCTATIHVEPAEWREEVTSDE